jgi:hypothetical protein
MMMNQAMKRILRHSFSRVFRLTPNTSVHVHPLMAT